MMRFWNDGWSCGPNGFLPGPMGMLSYIIFWFLIIMALIWLIQTIFTSENGSSKPSPLEILKHRYATGDINRDEYEEMRKSLLS